MSLPPVIWALLSYRAGESQQILGLAEALEARLEGSLRVFQPEWRRQAGLAGLLKHTGLAGLHHNTQACLRAHSPPDLLVTAGLRNEPVARWIARQKHGQTLTVLLGRTWAAQNAFDLVVTTPQYRLPLHPNVLHNTSTLHRLTAARLDLARQQWAIRYEALPRPRLGLLVGGDSGPFHLGPRNARRLAERALALAGRGSILGTTSSRTHPAAIQVLSAMLTTADLWHWNPAQDNPYFGILAWADALLVTGDSIAMASEAIATGKPVRIFDLGGMRGSGRNLGDQTASTRAYRLLMRHGPARLSRDLTLAHTALIARSQAAWDDTPLPAQLSDSPGRLSTEDMDATITRIKELLERRR